MVASLLIDNIFDTDESSVEEEEFNVQVWTFFPARIYLGKGLS